MLLEVLGDREEDVLRFVGDLRVPPTSNQAERDVCPARTWARSPAEHLRSAHLRGQNP